MKLTFLTNKEKKSLQITKFSKISSEKKKLKQQYDRY